MKITSSRKDDILRRKAEYEADKSARQSKYNEQYSKWNNARHDLFDKVKAKIESGLAKFDALHFDVTVRDGRYGGDGLEFKLDCNEDAKFDESSALSWNYSAYIGSSGDVEKETSSWSGLKGVTAEQLESLRQTLGALEYLNSIDWATTLNVKTPDPADYIDGTNPTYESAPEDFDKLLIDAEVDDIIGTTSGILSNNSRYYRGQVYRFITKQSDKSFTVFDIPVAAVERYVSTGEMTSEELYIRYTDAGEDFRIQKAKFYDDIVEPIKILKF